MNFSARNLTLFTLLMAQPALAQAAAAPADSTRSLLMNLPILLAFCLIFWISVMRPQSQQQKRQNEFLSALKKGDEVVTAGGIIGKIVGLTDRVVTLEISPDTEIKVVRAQVQAFLSEAIPANQPATK